MSEFGTFAPFGLFEFGAGPSPGEASYRSQIRSVEQAFDVSEGTHVEATIYARAMALASLKATLRHARQQRRPMRAVEMLGSLEQTFGISPVPGDSDDMRRRTLAARKRIPRGASPANIAAVLTDLLGDDFIRVITLPADAIPPLPGDVGSWDAAEAETRMFRILSGVLQTGVPWTFTYESLLDDSARIAVGDVLAAQTENRSVAEAVTIAAVDNASSPPRATATFQNAHDVGASLRTHAPFWFSEKRRLTILVKPHAADNPRTRERIDEEMRRIVRGTTEWSIARESSPGVMGPFTIGTSPIGSVPIGTTLTI